jgi:hypothetical protein
MRGKIKQIMFDWISGLPLPSGCEYIAGSGGFTITNITDPWANWEVCGSSASWDKVTYRIFNHYEALSEIEKGILLIGKYNES